ncbi:MAG: methyltransferase domain-containing protein [Pseudomonadota bacterium]
MTRHSPQDPSQQQTWNAQNYETHARFVSELAGDVFSLLAPEPGERILDLGCGDGALTEKIVKAGAEVVGVDASLDLLEAAKSRGLDVRQMDGHHLTFDHEFNAVFSNAALHWMSRPQEVIAGIRRCLKPGGRFVAEMGGHGNVSSLIIAMRAIGQKYDGDISLAGPWFFPTPQQYRGLLEAAGFTVQDIGLFPRPTPLPTGAQGWILHFRKPFFDQFEEPLRSKVVQEVVELLRPCLCDHQGNWTADYVRLRVRASIQ